MSAPTVTFEVDGQDVPLRECDWQLLAPCGCVFGLQVAALDCMTADQAMAEFYPRKRERQQRVGAGYRMRIGRRSDGVRLLSEPCTHNASQGGGS